ncbi:tRNA pseudouridine synthase A, partial [Candidatus Sulcia muelleri str. Hc (Homalodisca coagulata)]
SFCKKKCNYKTYICKIFNAKWHIKNNILNFKIEANRNKRKMERTMVGTLIELGIGKITIKEFINIL